MKEFGYFIHNVLVTDIEPAKVVKAGLCTFFPLNPVRAKKVRGELCWDRFLRRERANPLEGEVTLRRFLKLFSQQPVPTELSFPENYFLDPLPPRSLFHCHFPPASLSPSFTQR
jgi:hypothetical protein